LLIKKEYLHSISIPDCKMTILELLEKLESTKNKFLFITNKNNQVVGTLVDGDIRRFLLQGNNLKSTYKIQKTSFLYLNINSSFDEVCKKFTNKKIDYLPILNKDMNLLNVITKKQFHIMLLEDIAFDLNYDFFQLEKYTLEHEICKRPWGYYKSTIYTSHAQSKIITVFPNEELSLQEHKRREEHWIIIKGNGVVTLGESLINIYPGKYIYIPKGCKHQIINNSDVNIIFSEVQLGDYFGEDDIIRYSDKYNRIK
jgi:mannose-1-phosphate guanylyltransferase / mannose-6-phosphate isomerase